MKHLSIEDIEIYLADGKNAHKNIIRHIQHCDVCKKAVDEQLSVHLFLKKIKPMHASNNLFEKTAARLQKQPEAFFIDSLFVPAFVLLVILALFFFIKTPKKINPLPIDRQINIETGYSQKNNSYEKITYYINTFSKSFYYMGKRYSNEMIISALVILIFFFYSALDNYVKRKLL